jgi:hypothetical protein
MLTFSERIRLRQRELWSISDQGAHAEVCEHERRTRYDRLESWHCCPQWQRKLSDKLNAKEFAIRSGVRVAGLLWCGMEPTEIPFDTLPLNYVVKLTNGWNGDQVIPIRDGTFDVLRSRRLSQTGISQELVRMREAISDSRARVIVEELLPGRGDELPLDYKFFCFRGIAKLLYVSDRHRNTLTWYDRRWTPLSDQMHTEKRSGPLEPPPTNLHRMLKAAEWLSELYQFEFVRVDLYSAPDGSPVFGEFTHTPFGGNLDLFTPWADRMLGALWAGDADEIQVEPGR